MKKTVFTFAFMAAISLFAASPVLHYDFSQPVFVQGGKYKQPIIPPTAKMTAKPQALQIFGKEELTVPNSADFSLCDGGTIYAVVRFDEDGVKNNSHNAHDMVIFKNGGFLMGRNTGSLYFNVSGKGAWNCAVIAPGIKRKAWTALAVTVKKNGANNYTIKLFLDGKLAVTRAYKGMIKEKSSFPITFGRARQFGYAWNMTGALGKVLLYKEALSDAEIAKMVSKESCLK